MFSKCNVQQLDNSVCRDCFSICLVTFNWPDVLIKLTAENRGRSLGWFHGKTTWDGRTVEDYKAIMYTEAPSRKACPAVTSLKNLLYKRHLYYSIEITVCNFGFREDWFHWLLTNIFWGVLMIFFFIFFILW